MLTRCPHCSKAIRISEEHLDEIVYCPACRKSLVVSSPVVQPPPDVVPPPAKISYRTIRALRTILTAIHSRVLRLRSAFAEHRRKVAERQRQEEERQQQETKQRQLVAAQREAERQRRHETWLREINREIAAVAENTPAAEAMVAGEQMAAMVLAARELGPMGFNDGKFSLWAQQLWSGLQHPSLRQLPTLHAHLQSILDGFTAGSRKILQARSDAQNHRPAGPIIAVGRNVPSMLASAAVSYGVQALFNNMAASAVESQARQGVDHMVNAAREFMMMVEEFHRWQEPGRQRREHQAKQDRAQNQRATQTSAKSDYEILEVSPNASHEQIDAAYRRLTQMYHPDKVESLAPEYKAIALAKMKEINAAYARVKSQRKKQ